MAVVVVSCFGPWSMTWWSTVECLVTTLGLVTEGCSVVSDCMLISIQSVSVEPLEMSFAEVAGALAPQARDLKPVDLLNPLPLMCVFKKLNLS